LRQKARQHGPRPVFETDALPWEALSAACSAGDAAVLDSLWQNDKRPEQARAAAVRVLFAGACARDDLPLAAWVLGLHAQHVDAKTLRHVADHALRQGQTGVWPFLCDVTDARTDAAEIYKSLFKTALENTPPHLSLPAAQKIFPCVGAGASSYLYAAVLGDNMPALVWLAEACRAGGDLSRADLDKALLLAVDRAQTPMASYLLKAGADAGAFDEAALKRAAPHTDADGGTLLALLVGAGAHPAQAQQIALRSAAGAPLAQRLAKVAEKTAAAHIQKLAEVCGQPPDAARLAAYQPALGKTGLHYAAESRILHTVPKNSFNAISLAQKNAEGETVIDVLVRRGAAEDFFTPAAWRGQVQKLAAVLDLLPACIWDETARAACLRRAERLTLEEAIPADGFKLTRRPKH